jgi:ubiquinone biosynthesis protein COQ4
MASDPRSESTEPIPETAAPRAWPEIPPCPPLPPLRWRRALRSLRALIADSDDTEKAIDLFYAIGIRDHERSFERFAATPTGRRLLAERPSLPGALSDRVALARLAEGTLGRAYLAYLDRTGFDPVGLVELQLRVQARWEAEEGMPPPDPLRAWFRDRSILVHDLFHVLTDYGTDDLGEATLLAFTVGQFGGRANWLLTLGASLECLRALGPRWLPYVVRAWRRGRGSTWLLALPWEELLPLRLDTVRRLVGVAPADEAHPAGIWRGRIDERHRFVPVA